MRIKRKFLASIMFIAWPIVTAHAADKKAMPPTQAPPIATTVAVGSAERGGVLYPQRCGGCHNLETNRIGPAHRGVVGRKAGVAPGFAYSPALKNANIVFNEATLERWLTNPQATVPGARMFFRLGAAQERADIIAYLKSQPSAR